MLNYDFIRAKSANSYSFIPKIMIFSYHGCLWKLKEVEVFKYFLKTLYRVVITFTKNAFYRSCHRISSPMNFLEVNKSKNKGILRYAI